MARTLVVDRNGPLGRIAIALVAGLATLTTAAVAQAPQTPLPADTSATAETADAPMSEWERFVYDRTARMTVPVSINGTTAVPFIIDTGSERTVISRELAASLTLPPAKAMLLATVSGPVVADSYRIRHLANGGFAVSNFDAPALARRHMGIDGLIGIESLKDKIVVFDFAGQKMQVLPSRGTSIRVARGEDAIIVTAQRKHGRLILSDARINGRRVDLVIDTGSQSSVGNLALKRLMAARSNASAGIASESDRRWRHAGRHRGQCNSRNHDRKSYAGAPANRLCRQLRARRARARQATGNADGNGRAIAVRPRRDRFP